MFAYQWWLDYVNKNLHQAIACHSSEEYNMTHEWINLEGNSKVMMMHSEEKCLHLKNKPRSPVLN